MASPEVTSWMDERMSALRANPTSLYAGDVSPKEAWDALQNDLRAQLIDVRTAAEWSFAGLPVLDSIGKTPETLSWKFYPHFDLNPDFIARLEQRHPDKTAPLYFLCKSGGRSADAAMAATQAGYTHAYNIQDGFEGDLNTHHQRGGTSGWKAAGLPWQQA